MSVIVPRHRCLVLRKNGATGRPDDDMVFAAEPAIPARALRFSGGEPLPFSNNAFLEFSV